MIKSKNITKKMRSGFTMVELLFVMAVLAALAAIAIPQLKGGSDSATMTSMRSDAKNAITEAQTFYSINDSFPGTSANYIDKDGDGLSDTIFGGADGTNNIAISKDNTVNYQKKAGDCFFIKVTNPNLPKKSIQFDSCNSGKITTVTAK
jgi:type IV pilus assembly protein PilA